MNPNDRRTVVRLERIYHVLKQHDKDQWALAEAIAMCRRHVRDYVDHVVEIGTAHIVDWRRYGHDGPYIPVLRLGPGISVPKPVALTMLERKHKMRAQVKADKDRHELHLKKERARKRAVVRDPLVAALFG